MLVKNIKYGTGIHVPAVGVGAVAINGRHLHDQSARRFMLQNSAWNTNTLQKKDCDTRLQMAKIRSKDLEKLQRRLNSLKQIHVREETSEMRA